MLQNEISQNLPQHIAGIISMPFQVMEHIKEFQ